MGTVNLGRVRDRVTGVERINGNGSAGTIDTYRVSFESSNYYDFNVTNGRNGVGQIVSFSGNDTNIANLIYRIVNNQDNVLALLVRSDSDSTVNNGYMQASFKVEKTLYTELPVDYLYGVTAYSPTGSQLFIATYKQSLSSSEPRDFGISFSSGFSTCLNAWCLLYYNDSSTGLTVDDTLSDSSTNPVQNKVIAKFANDVAGTYATNDDLNDLETEVANIKSGTTHLFENITDSHGNPRFVEGNITITSNYDITPIYAKWSLSGSHLMIVICGSFTEGTVIDNTKVFARINSLPSYIFDKIIPIISTRSFVSTINAQYLYSTGSTILSLPCTLIKQTNNLDVYFSDSLIATHDGALRAQFDLLIDDE